MKLGRSVLMRIVACFLLCATAIACLADEPIYPIPASSSAIDSEKVALGRRLFAETRLSHDNTISCASCHLLDLSGADGRRVGKGINVANGKRNVPTVFNA